VLVTPLDTDRHRHATEGTHRRRRSPIALRLPGVPRPIGRTDQVQPASQRGRNLRRRVPVCRCREDRIRAHIQLCWLALLLLRVIENATGDTWRNTRRELDRMHLVTLSTNAGRVAQRSAITPGQQTVLRALDLPELPRFFDFTLPDSR